MSVFLFIEICIYKTQIYRMKKIIFFDVCNTLVDTNSTVEYVNFLVKNNVGNEKCAKLLKNKYLSYFSYIVRKYTKYDLHRKITFKFFKWINIKDEKNLQSIFFNEYFSKRTKVMDILINSIDKKQNDIYLISASINQPIDLLSKHLGVKSFSSKLIIENDVYTWKAQYDLLWNKEYALKNSNISLNDYNECLFYTDNISDFSFIKFLQIQSNNLKVYPIINNKRNITIRQKFLNNNEIKYEFIS